MPSRSATWTPGWARTAATPCSSSSNNGRDYSLHNYYNLNDVGRGPGLYKMLMTAMAGGFRIRAYDHHYPYCDDVDEIEIYR